MKNLDSTSIDLSTSDLDYQCKELLNALELTMSTSRDGEIMLNHNSGTSMKSLRLSRITTGSLTHSTSKEMEHQQISDVPLLTQDGGNCGNLMVPS
jgi:hypothetical protein